MLKTLTIAELINFKTYLRETTLRRFRAEHTREQNWQAMPVLIHTGPQRRKSLCDFPLRLLVEGSAPKPL